MGLEAVLVKLGVDAALASTIATGASVVSGVTSVLGGIQGMQSGNQQAEYAKAQGIMNAKEQQRQAFKQAQVEKENATDAERRQKLAYLASGVSLEGSPLLVMAETRRKGQENVDEILRSGAAASSAANMEGRMQAQKYKSAGREALISGITGAIR